MHSQIQLHRQPHDLLFITEITPNNIDIFYYYILTSDSPLVVKYLTNDFVFILIRLLMYLFCTD